MEKIKSLCSNFKNFLKCRKEFIVNKLSDVDHLSPETVVSYIDGELSAKSQFLVTKHLLVCKQCAKAVSEQKKVSGTINKCCKKVDLPQNLLKNLNNICTDEKTKNKN